MLNLYRVSTMNLYTIRPVEFKQTFICILYNGKVFQIHSYIEKWFFWKPERKKWTGKNKTSKNETGKDKIKKNKTRKIEWEKLKEKNKKRKIKRVKRNAKNSIKEKI